jgi:16S rRNA (guanine1516-N2)-methyltransferase
MIGDSSEHDASSEDVGLSEAELARVTEARFELLREDSFLGVRDLEDDKAKPLVVDFLSGQFLHRLTHLAKSDPLAKAVGLKSFDPVEAPYVMDLTAGLGTDAFLLAAMGCCVRAVERTEVVEALLADGYERAREAISREDLEGRALERLKRALTRLSIEHADSIEILKSLPEGEEPDVIYLDPMYPEEGRSKSALPKKGMRFFRRLVGGDLDADELFQLALKTARLRVVIKRPLKAPHLGGKKPSHSQVGKTARFDIYVARG